MAPSSDVSEALATLQARWGAAAPRRGGEMRAGSDLHLAVEGALARAPMPLDDPDDLDRPDAPTPRLVPLAPAGSPRPAPPSGADDGRVVPTGFAALDAILGTGGLPRSATVALRGDASSGKTTLALRVAAEAQATGAIVAWLDLARAFDPVEAVARGVRPEWLVVLTPVDLEEALALSAALLAARTVDLLVVDLPDGRDPAVSGVRVGDRLGRLAALARRAGTLLVVVEPNALGRAPGGRRRGGERPAAGAGAGRLDPAGPGRGGPAQRRDRRPQPPRAARAAHGPRDPVRGGRRPGRLSPAGGAAGRTRAPPASRPRHRASHPGPPHPRRPPSDLKGPPASTDTHAPAAPALAAPAAPARPVPPRVTGERRHLRLVAARPDRPRRTALDGRDGGRRGPARSGPRRAPGDPARERPPAGTRGDLPRPRA